MSIDQGAICIFGLSQNFLLIHPFQFYHEYITMIVIESIFMVLPNRIKSDITPTMLNDVQQIEYILH